MMKLLVSCRDVGAVLHLIEIIKNAKQHKINLKVIAQNPAAQYLTRERIPIEFVDLPSSEKRNDRYGTNLLNFAEKIIDFYKPDAILTGLSTPFDGGIDEAVVAKAKSKVITYMMQDFWGECNFFFGEKPDYVLCIDDWAARLTQQQHAVKTICIGAPKYSRYGECDFFALRVMCREALSLRKERVVIGLFGQALHRLSGYTKTVNVWIEAVKKLDVEAAIVYRPHPRESVEEIQKTIDLFRQHNVEVTLIPLSFSPKQAISLCNIVCSPFSNCSYDCAHINYFCETPFVTPINLLFDREIREYCYKVTNLKETPFKHLGISLNIESEEDVFNVLKDAALANPLKKLWQASKKLKNPIDASDKALQKINQRVEV